MQQRLKKYLGISLTKEVQKLCIEKSKISLKKFIFFLTILLRERERELARAQTGGATEGEREADRLPIEQGAGHGAGSQDSGIMTRAKGRCLTEPPRYPSLGAFIGLLSGCFNLINPPGSCYQ